VTHASKSYRNLFVQENYSCLTPLPILQSCAVNKKATSRCWHWNNFRKATC